MSGLYFLHAQDIGLVGIKEGQHSIEPGSNTIYVPSHKLYGCAHSEQCIDCGVNYSLHGHYVPSRMKTILLFRHGKSDWYADYSHDHERPLAPRGRRAARAMGRWLSHTRPEPDHIICSTARRTRQTCRLASVAGGWAATVENEAKLYGGDCRDLLDCIYSAPDHSSVLMLIGHQPTWSEAAAVFSRQAVAHFPTGTMARVDLPVNSWLDVEFGIGTLVWLQTPKKLPAHYHRQKDAG